MRWIWGVIASSLSIGCSGQLGAAPERDAGVDASERGACADASAGALGPMPCPTSANSDCGAHFVRVSWVAPDGGLERCECLPACEVQCVDDGQVLPDAAPPETPLGPSLCQCNVCGPERVQTFRCGYDPYYGDITFAECIE